MPIRARACSLPRAINGSHTHRAARVKTDTPAAPPKAVRKGKARAGEYVDPLEALIPLLPVYTYTDAALGAPPAVVYTADPGEADDLVGALRPCLSPFPPRAADG
jgi:hypothetical protein